MQNPTSNPKNPNDGIFVIFGVTGDLSKRKLLPALYQLMEKGLLSEKFRIVGITRRDTRAEDLIDQIKRSLQEEGSQADEKTLEKLQSRITLVNMNIEARQDYQKLEDALTDIDRALGEPANRLFYLAVPPKMVGTIVSHLGAQGLHDPSEKNCVSRLLVEKPFGYDIKSAVELIEQMEQAFDEDHIYRVDHYLAKETVQNILTFRFKNPLFEAVWDKSTVEHIMITASEKIGIEGRANFYENTGALRDLVQSHLLQLLALIAMEEPTEQTSRAIHEAKLALLKSVAPIAPEKVVDHSVRGQYDTYRSEADNPQSFTETYAAVRLEINNSRWQGVPVLIRAGKAMAEKVTEITLVFKPSDKLSPNRNALTIRIQPDEGIVLSLLAKKPSFEDKAEMVQMNFSYDQHFSDSSHPDAYERVLVDAIRGDKTLFTTDQEVLAAWRVIENVINAWSENGQGLETYNNGSWGPVAADKLAGNCGAQWRTKTLHIAAPA